MRFAGGEMSSLALNQVLPDLEPVLVVEGSVDIGGVDDRPSFSDNLVLRGELRASFHGDPGRQRYCNGA